MSSEYLSLSKQLLNDFKNYAARDEREDILNKLQMQLEKNRTRTMTFTEDGLELAIKIINEMEPSDYNDQDYSRTN